jgi:hypothetical protein
MPEKLRAAAVAVTSSAVLGAAFSSLQYDRGPTCLLVARIQVASSKLEDDSKVNEQFEFELQSIICSC